MTDEPKEPNGQDSFRVRRGRVGSVDLYEVKDSELDILEKGSPADLQLNFAIFLISTAISSISTLVTATFTNPTVRTVFVVVSVVGILLGTYLLISWWRNRTSLKTLCKSIRQRIPPDTSSLSAGTPEPPKPK